MERFVITKDGMELQTKLVAGTTTALFTKISVSDHQYVKDELHALTELVEVRQTVLVSSIERKEAAQVEVMAAIGNAGLDNGFDIRTLGLYAEDGEGNEVLYAVSISGDHPDYMPPYTDDALSEITYRMNIAVGSSEQVAIYVKPGAIPTVEQVEDIRADVDEVIKGNVCNLLYLPDAVNANSAGEAVWHGGNFSCRIPSEDIVVWSGEIALPEGGYAFPASSDSADVIVAYALDGTENRVEISAGAVLPEGAVVTEYRLERKDGENRIVADIWPMVSPGKRPVSEYVPYTGDERRMNRCVALVLKAVEKLHKFCLEKFLTKEDIANNLVTTNAGWALDARQGKVLKDEINQRLSFEKKNTNVGNTFDISGYMADNWAMLVIGRATSTVPDSGFIFLVSGVGDCFVHVAPIHAVGGCASVTVRNGFLTVNYIVGEGNAFIIPFNQ